MANQYPKEYPWVESKVLKAPAVKVFNHLVERLNDKKYELIDSLPADLEASDFESRFIATREIDITSIKRRNGKIMLFAAIVSTFGLFVMLAEDIWAERGIISTPLLAVVVLGGLGLNRLNIPVRKKREIMEFFVQGKSGSSTTITVKGASGISVSSQDPDVWTNEIDNLPILEYLEVVSLDD